jgi:hypothetical protein
MKYPKIECAVCKREISNTNFKRHKEACGKSKDFGTCPVCGKAVQYGRTTCSYSCSNTFFRTGEDNGSYKSDDKAMYRTVCFRHHKKKCIICDENKIVAVHHYDENRSNNDWKNLIPMCPTHHSYMCSRWKHLIEEKVDKYHQNCV